MSDVEARRDLARLWRVSRTVNEMMRDRGYKISDFEINVPFDTFKDGYIDRPNLSFHVDHATIPGDRIYVHFCGEKNVSKAAMKSFITTLDTAGAKRGVIIWAEKMSPAAKKTEYHLEDFPEVDLLVNITKHTLVPKHTVMSADEKAALIKRYRLKDTQLPRIMHTDPVARYYGLRRGQVMKIERPSETAGRYITYRICM